MLKQFALAVIASAAIALPAIAAPATPAPSADAAAKAANPEDANPLLPTKADMEKARAEREAARLLSPLPKTLPFSRYVIRITAWSSTS